ncbi:MAG: lipoate--protein ligase family protein [Firmicutes bacterium]|nr:lipoate--protein ligase family protein [Bacillota bacterium]
MSETWRLLPDLYADGQTQMATDEALLLGGFPYPTLRFYRFSPPALTYGYHQSADEIDQQACALQHWDAVRRPTGGRAVLHLEDLTYAVLLPEGSPWAEGSIGTVFGRIAAALAEGLKRIGVKAQLATPRDRSVDPAASSAHRQKEAACFDAPGAYEVEVSGRKLVGSAQVRREGRILQHGTLPLLDITAETAQVLYPNDPDRKARTHQALLAGSTSVAQAAGRFVRYPALRAALLEGFMEAFGGPPTFTMYTSQELRLQATLRAKRTGNEAKEKILTRA